MNLQCRCGQPLEIYAWDQVGGAYDAWVFQDTATEHNLINAASRDDVLAWLTGFRPPAHDVMGDETLVIVGQCQTAEITP